MFFRYRCTVGVYIHNTSYIKWPYVHQCDIGGLHVVNYAEAVLKDLLINISFYPI